MYFVNDVHFVVAAAAEQVHVLAQVADVVYTGIRGGVDLDDIGRASTGDFLARDTFVAWLAIVGILTVDGFGQQPGDAGFPRSARATEEIGMRQPPVTHGVEQRADDLFLTDELSEGLRSPFAIKGLRRHTMPHVRVIFVSSAICRKPLHMLRTQDAQHMKGNISTSCKLIISQNEVGRRDVSP